MAINIQIGANSTQVGEAKTDALYAKNKAVEAEGIARGAARDAGNAISAATGAVNAVEGFTGAISDINNHLSEMSGDVSDALSTAREAAEIAGSASGKAAEAVQRAEEAIEMIESGSGIAPEDRQALQVIKDFTTEHGVNIKEYIDDLGNTFVTIDSLEEDYDFATTTDLDNMNRTLGNRINEITSGDGVDFVRNAIDNWQDPPIAMKSEILPEVDRRITAAENSIVQEVGDMIEGVREMAGDDINIEALAIPTEESENSSNESFNELVSKLQEKPIRRADVLKKVIDEDAFYWYVMPVIDQRIYRDTIVNGVVVEAGWQKAVKERYWYHKQDTDIRDHYIYLYRSDINLNATKATEENTAANNKPNILPLRGNPRTLHKIDEIPSGLAIIGARINKNGRKLNPTVETAELKQPAKDKYAMHPLLKMKPGKGDDIPVNVKTLNQEQISAVKLNGGVTEIQAAQKRKLPNKTIKSWFNDNQNNKNKKLTDPEYPADFLYIGCYAECDDSSMYEKRWYKLTNQGEADTSVGIAGLTKRDDGSYYYMDGETEVTVPKDERAEFYVNMNVDTRVISGPNLKVTDPNVDFTQLTRRTFADVSRDIKVHMLPIYIPGSTIIAGESSSDSNDIKQITIDSILTPAFVSGDKGKRSTITPTSGESGAIAISNTNKSKNYVCKENVRMAKSGLPCVYGQGYTWLPLDAKGDADDNTGLGVHCAFTQDEMWIADGVYSSYNGLIPSGYTKETLKNLATLYKYKIVEKFVYGEWSTENGKMVWTNNKYDTHESGDGRIQEETSIDPETGKKIIIYPGTTQPENTQLCCSKIFVDDYSEDNIADLNEEIFDINIDDEYITYTIKDGMMVQNDPSGGATVSNFIYDTLSYLTQKGTVNTNNIFLFCVEDDGDEYIFDEYIWEKGKVLKLNEQKRIKYSEDLRKVEYVQADGEHGIYIGHEGTFVYDGHSYQVEHYDGSIVGGVDAQGQPLKTKDEQADLIIRYLSVLTQKDTGATIKNPKYVPPVVGNFHAGLSFGEGGRIGTQQMYNYNEFGLYLQELTQSGIISGIAAILKQAMLWYAIGQKSPEELKIKLNEVFVDSEGSIYAYENMTYSGWENYIRPYITISNNPLIDTGYSKEIVLRIESLKQAYAEVYTAQGEDSTETLRTIINDTIGYAGNITDPNYNPDYFANNLFGIIVGLYKKMDIGNSEKGEEGIPAGEEEPGKEGKSGLTSEILDWIHAHYHSSYLYLIEFLILNKIIGFVYKDKYGEGEKPTFDKADFDTRLMGFIDNIYDLCKATSTFNYVKESYEHINKITQDFKDAFIKSEYHETEPYNTYFDENIFGVLTGCYIAPDADIKYSYRAAQSAQGGSEFISVKTDIWIPITTEGGDYLQKYNKILAFLIDKQPVGNSNGYEWTYSLWRYMPSSKQYATVGTVSTISVNEPDLNNKEIESEVGSANNTDTHSEISNAIRVAREDIMQRYDKLLTEDGILSMLPKINKIIEQNFVSNTKDGQTVYSLKNAVTPTDLNAAVERQNNIETNMTALVSAMNAGKRASYVNGVMTMSQENIFESATPTQSTLPAPTAPETLVIPETTGDAVQHNTTSNNTGRYFVDNAGNARRRIFI